MKYSEKSRVNQCFSLPSLLSLLVASAYLFDLCRAGANNCLPIKYVRSGKNARRLVSPYTAYMSVTVVNDGREIGIQPTATRNVYFVGDLYALENGDSKRVFITLFWTKSESGRRVAQVVGNRFSGTLELEYNRHRIPTSSCDEAIFECSDNAYSCRRLVFGHSDIIDFQIWASIAEGPPLTWCITGNASRLRLRLVPITFCTDINKRLWLPLKNREY